MIFSGHSYWVLYFEVNRLVMIRGFWMIVLQNQGNQLVKLLFKALNIPRLAPLEARSDSWKDEAIRARDFLGIEMHHNLYDDFESSQRERERKKILADPLYPVFFVQCKGPTNQCWQFVTCAIRVLLVCALLPGKSPGVLHIHHCRQGDVRRCKSPWWAMMPWSNVKLNHYNSRERLKFWECLVWLGILGTFSQDDTRIEKKNEMPWSKNTMKLSTESAVYLQPSLQLRGGKEKGSFSRLHWGKEIYLVLPFFKAIGAER